MEHPEIVLDLRNYRFDLLEDDVAQRNYSFELQKESEELAGPDAVWFGIEGKADKGEHLDNWIRFLRPLCKHYVEDDETLDKEKTEDPNQQLCKEIAEEAVEQEKVVRSKSLTSKAILEVQVTVIEDSE